MPSGDGLINASVRLDVYKRADPNAALLGVATGFVVRTRRSLYLVSCLHTFTNLDPQASRPKHVGKPGTPDEIAIWFRGHRPGRWIKAYYGLADAQGLVFVGHPRDPKIDVGVLPIQIPGDARFDAVGLSALSGADEVQIGDRLVIPGFPHGLESKAETRGFGGYPICKTVHLATPMGYEHEGRPVALVDGACRTGMSGSPTFLRTTRDWVCYGVFAAQHEGAELGEIVKVTALSECLHAAIHAFRGDVKPLRVHQAAF